MRMREFRRSMEQVMTVSKYLVWGQGFKSKKMVHLSVVLSALGFGVYRFIWKKRSNPHEKGELPTQKNMKPKVAVNGIFFRRLFRIMGIIIPSWQSSEFVHLITLTLLLIARTLLSIQVAEVTGKNARYLVQRRWRDMLRGVLIFSFLGVPASVVNGGLKYETNILSLKFKRRLTEHINQQYLHEVNFYRASHLGAPRSIDNVDQRLTSDVYKFCENLAKIYSASIKPIIDVMLFAYQLSGYIGRGGPLIFMGYYACFGLIKQYIMPKFGSLTARESQLEGDYRTAHQRLIANAEEIGFYNGSAKERTIIQRLFRRKYYHEMYTYWVLGLVQAFDSFMVKYGTSITGYIILSIPVFFPKPGQEFTSISEITQAYVRNRQLLINLSIAISHVVVFSNQVTSLAGYTARVAELLDVISSSDESGKKPFNIIPDPEDSSPRISQFPRQWLEGWKRRGEELRELREPAPPSIITPTQAGALIIPGKFIKFENVSLVSPDGRVLVNDLCFEVKLHQNVIVAGPNGSGKSTLFRIIGELWPLQCGTVVKPRKEDILFIPQKPYLVIGTLRDQIIYPHTLEEMKARKISDDDLFHLMEIVDPASTILGQWNLDTVKDWAQTLSGGQKQRMAIARLFYHRPLFAILDECTSAVSAEVEDQIYQTCNQLGITLFTVSHREALRKYHDFILQFDGRGNWQWTEIDPLIS